MTDPARASASASASALASASSNLAPNLPLAEFEFKPRPLPRGAPRLLPGPEAGPEQPPEEVALGATLEVLERQVAAYTEGKRARRDTDAAVATALANRLVQIVASLQLVDAPPVDENSPRELQVDVEQAARQNAADDAAMRAKSDNPSGSGSSSSSSSGREEEEGEDEEEATLSEEQEQSAIRNIRDAALALKRELEDVCGQIVSPDVARLIEWDSIEQRTTPWYKVRNSRLTASDAAGALGIKGFFTTQKELFKKKTGQVNGGFRGSAATRHGQVNEDVAIAKYEERYNTRVFSFGLFLDPVRSWLGGSPDGVTKEGVLIEVKCPYSRPIIAGQVPAYYLPQVQTLMAMMQLEECHFIQFRPEGPWSGEEFDVTVVMRDREWEAVNFPKMEAFWNDVLEYREKNPDWDAFDFTEEKVGKKRKVGEERADRLRKLAKSRAEANSDAYFRKQSEGYASIETALKKCVLTKDAMTDLLADFV